MSFCQNSPVVNGLFASLPGAVGKYAADGELGFDKKTGNLAIFLNIDIKMEIGVSFLVVNSGAFMFIR